MAWGTDIMMLGRIKSRMNGAVTAAPLSLAALDWVSIAGGYAGAWGGGAGVGYLVGRSAQSALTGGVAASGFWGVSQAIGAARAKQVALTTMFLGVGGASLFLAWHLGHARR